MEPIFDYTFDWVCYNLLNVYADEWLASDIIDEPWQDHVFSIIYQEAAYLSLYIEFYE